MGLLTPVSYLYSVRWGRVWETELCGSEVQFSLSLDFAFLMPFVQLYNFLQIY